MKLSVHVACGPEMQGQRVPGWECWNVLIMAQDWLPSQQDMAQDWLPKSTLRKRNGEEHKTREGKKRSGVMKVMSMERIGASHFLPNRTPLLPTR